MLPHRRVVQRQQPLRQPVVLLHTGADHQRVDPHPGDMLRQVLSHDQPVPVPE